jgi:hypothetical protein
MGTVLHFRTIRLLPDHWGRKVKRLECSEQTVVERPWLRADCCPCVVEGVNRVTSNCWQRRCGAVGVFLYGVVSSGRLHH